MKRLVVCILMVALSLCSAVGFAERSDAEALQQILKLLVEKPEVVHQFLDSLEQGTFSEAQDDQEGAVGAHNISVDQMMRDLKESDAQVIHYGRWVYFDENTVFDTFEITKTLSKDTVVDYYVSITGTSFYDAARTRYSDFDGPILLRYESFKEGWALTRVQTVDGWTR